MSMLGRFLSPKEPLFDHALHQLELVTHHKGVDVRLTAEIAGSAARALSTLDLPPDASGADAVSGPRLYDALIDRIARDDEHLARTIGGVDPHSVREMLPLVAQAYQAADLPRDGYFLKPDRARELIRHLPPMAIMDRLGYHLVSRLLESEDIDELMLAIRFVEDPAWLIDFDRLYHDLIPDDFETRPIRLITLAPEKWGHLPHTPRRPHHHVVHSKEMGLIGVLPTHDTHVTGITLKTLALILHAHNEVRHYSSFFRLMAPKQNFGAIVSDTLINDPDHVELKHITNIHWRVLHRYYGHTKGNTPPYIFEPHLQSEDLHWRKAETVLAEIDPNMAFWRDLDYVAVTRGATHNVITFNLTDLTLGYTHGLTYDERPLYHFRDALWNEIFARYLGQETLEQQLLVRLNDYLIAPDTLIRRKSHP